jgi:hypothetical protein
LIEKVQLPAADAQAKNEAILEDDEEILESPYQDDEDDDDVEPIMDFNEVEDLELAKALEDAYLTPPPSEDDDSPCAFHVQYPIDQELEQTRDSFDSQGVFGGATKGSFSADLSYEDRFEDFVSEKITPTYHGAFNAGRKFNLDSRLREGLQKAGRKRDARLHKANFTPVNTGSRNSPIIH